MDALTAAGYSPAQARKGRARIVKSKGLLAAVAKYPLEVRAGLVRLRLIQNLMTGEDVATKSARLLGLDKEVGLWQDERAQTQVLVIQAPSGWHRGAPITAEEIARTAPIAAAQRKRVMRIRVNRDQWLVLPPLANSLPHRCGRLL